MYGSKFKENLIKIGPQKKLKDVPSIEFKGDYSKYRMNLAEELGF